MQLGPTVEGIARGARKVNLVVGAMLVASAFLVGQTLAHAVNQAIVGVIAILVAFASLRIAPKLRLGNALVGLWLFVSLFVLPGRAAAATVIDMIASTMLFGFAFVPDRWDDEALAL